MKALLHFQPTTKIDFHITSLACAKGTKSRRSAIFVLLLCCNARDQLTAFRVAAAVIDETTISTCVLARLVPLEHAPLCARPWCPPLPWRLLSPLPLLLVLLLLCSALPLPLLLPQCCLL